MIANHFHNLPDTIMFKKELRHEYLTRRQSMCEPDYTTQSALIRKLYFEHFNPQKYPRIHIYLSCHKRKEVDTWAIVKTIMEHYPSVNLSTPKSVGGAGGMKDCLIDSNSIFEENKWGISEPSVDNFRSPKELSMVILPLIGFDTEGHRVGYGKGHYDRFLAQCNADTIKVGLCFEEPVPKILDINQYDIAMDYCITPKQVFRNRK